VSYEHQVTGELTAVRENGAVSGPGVLATMAYDDLARRKNIVRGNGTVSGYGYDPASRLASLVSDLGGVAYDARSDFGYNPAGQIVTRSRSNGVYAWSGYRDVDRRYGVNGLNQQTQAGDVALGHDARGNLTVSGSVGYTYDAQNQLKTKSGPDGAMLYYDGLGRLAEYDTSVSTRFAYDGEHMAAEVSNPSGAIVRRYVYGAGSDEPLVWYEGSGTGDRRWLHADERGSIVAVTDGGGNVMGVNRYDEHGIPDAGNIGRFQYTGQAWLADAGLYYYKARMYSPTLGRFLQTDPIGYADGLNWYAYVGNDPVNFTDPSGMKMVWSCAGFEGSLSCGWRDDGNGPGVRPGEIVSGPVGGRPEPAPVQGAGGSSAPTPQKADPKVIARNQCRIAAVAAGAGNVAVDLAGLIPGERAAAVIIRAATTAISGTNAIIGQDSAGGALTISGFFNDLRAALPTSTSGTFIKALGQSLPGLGVIITGASVTKDILDARKAYQKCGAQ
jgi:RHS repeat-associated protein